MSCPPCNQNCNQGRACPERLIQRNGGATINTATLRTSSGLRRACRFAVREVGLFIRFASIVAATCALLGLVVGVAARVLFRF